MTAPELLRIAQALDVATVDKMAHALGWPTGYALAQGGKAKRTKWAQPYRNYYYGALNDPHWLAAQSLSLAKLEREPHADQPDTVWTVTDLGQSVIRLRLQAIVLARKVTP